MLRRLYSLLTPGLVAAEPTSSTDAHMLGCVGCGWPPFQRRGSLTFVLSSMGVAALCDTVYKSDSCVPDMLSFSSRCSESALGPRPYWHEK